MPLPAPCPVHARGPLPLPEPPPAPLFSVPGVRSVGEQGRFPERGWAPCQGGVPVWLLTLSTPHASQARSDVFPPPAFVPGAAAAWPRRQPASPATTWATVRMPVCRPSWVPCRQEQVQPQARPVGGFTVFRCRLGSFSIYCAPSMGSTNKIRVHPAPPPCPFFCSVSRCPQRPSLAELRRPCWGGRDASSGSSLSPGPSRGFLQQEANLLLLPLMDGSLLQCWPSGELPCATW